MAVVSDGLELLRRRGVDRERAELSERLFAYHFTIQAIKRFARMGDVGAVQLLCDVALERDDLLRERVG